jgi:hypothetical protein
MNRRPPSNPMAFEEAFNLTLSLMGLGCGNRRWCFERLMVESDLYLVRLVPGTYLGCDSWLHGQYCRLPGFLSPDVCLAGGTVLFLSSFHRLKVIFTLVPRLSEESAKRHWD